MGLFSSQGARHKETPMKVRILAAAVLFLAGTPPLRAEKLPQDFRNAFEQAIRPKRSHAVVLVEGLPTTSIYGVKGDTTGGTAHYSIDVVDGGWKTSEGIMDFDQTAADSLRKGEVMEVASIAYKDNRLDLRMVSLEAHKVTRGSWILKSRKPEPVATNFKFFFPFRATGAADVPKALEYIGQYLRMFPGEAEARTYSARMMAGGGAPESAPSRPTTAAATTTKKDIKIGMTSLEVMEALGKPDKEVNFENKTRWTYPDLTVIFENGRVKEVRF
jgi:hypothetical protein